MRLILTQPQLRAFDTDANLLAFKPNKGLRAVRNRRLGASRPPNGKKRNDDP